MNILTNENREIFNPVNERAIYKYRKHLRACGKDEKTIAAIVKYIRSYQVLTNFDGFRTFNSSIADKFLEQIDNWEASESYLLHLMKASKEFLLWLSGERGYQKIKRNDIVKLRLTDNQLKKARATDYKKSYSFEQILKTIRQMPSDTVKEMENKAIISMQALGCFRVSELRTIKMRNLIPNENKYLVYVNPKDMNDVKRAKTREVFLLPLEQDILDNVLRWRDYLKEEEGFSERDPLFPAIPCNFKPRGLWGSNIKKHEIKSNSTIRMIFKQAFENAGYDYIRPHSFRHTVARWAERKTPELLNAVRQNLGHKSIQTTLQSYGELSSYDQGNRISEAEI
ncbi:MAG: site-specific integrase [Alphaproteobacteria bacterium]|jgi:integrase|nr:site-specific integrase [Alphaproteobacteria bacterium]